MPLDLNKPHTFVSKYHPIKLIATDFDEPYLWTNLMAV